MSGFDERLAACLSRAIPDFEKLVSADQKKEALIERANAQAIRTLASVAGEVEKAERIIEELARLEALERGGVDPIALARQEQVIMDLILDAGGQAASIIAGAKADRWDQHMDARAGLASSESQIAMFRAAPKPFLAQLLVQSYRRYASNSRVYLSPIELRLELNQEEEQAAISAFSEALEYEPGSQQE